ncbi:MULTISPECIES: hypothetical protein [unclassified Nocardiopsis]|uniref:hypothetical protein n=1 Tax=Nocardiopsis TaxID=2013 RepID=UPI00387AB378
MADQVRHGVHREARKTACPRGHKYSGSNLRITFDGRRACRACHREYARRRRAELADA